MLQLRQQGGKLSGRGQRWQPNPRLDALKPGPNDLVLLHMPALPDRDQYMPGLSPSSTATITIRSQGGNIGTAMSLGLWFFVLQIFSPLSFHFGHYNHYTDADDDDCDGD